MLRSKITSSRATMMRASPFTGTVSRAGFSQYFDKILIANRGEISRRVIKTCKKMNIKTVAIYSDPDSRAMFVREADEAYRVGPAASNQSYLNMDAILHAIKDSGAQAVHPGYGFLSENSKFQHLLSENGVKFIGPGTKAIEAMGDKITSKVIGKEAGINIIPGFIGEIHSNEEVLKIANEIGYPVMIKATAGGGGKGMRIAWNDKEALTGYRLSKAEALSSFGDDRIFIEKYIQEPRHIEFQLLADGFGNAIYLPERECSVQRRNQKVVEEAPSCLLDEVTRKAMGEQACSLAKAVGYETTGTVEFLVDKDLSFYFLEMNTRLQVEHPVTEYVTGIDLVEEMIKIAAGEEMTLTQKDVKPQGWAIESRIYAEDPCRGFLPSTGHLLKYQEPTLTENVRIDTGVEEGSEISMFYDPMICKLVTHGETRAEAASTMVDAIDNYVIRGVEHNALFCRDVLLNPKFASGHYSTKFIGEEYPEGFSLVRMEGSSLLFNAVTAFDLYQRVLDQKATLGARAFPDDMPHYVSVDGDVTVAVIREGNEYVATLNGEESRLAVSTNYHPGDVIFHADITGGSEDFSSEIQCISHNDNSFTLLHKGRTSSFKIYSEIENKYNEHMPEVVEEDGTKMLRAPMPGLIVSMNVKEGETVDLGQELLVLEAMKMQNVIAAEHKGVVKKVHYKSGDSVAVDELLVEFE